LRPRASSTGPAAAKIAAPGEDTVATSNIVPAELRCGAARKEPARRVSQPKTILGALEVISFEAPANSTCGNARVALEASSDPFGENDILIAAQALALDDPLPENSPDMS